MEFDSVHNYYERLVFNEIKDNYTRKGLDGEALTDMACLALNEIRPRYIRHDIDMSFFMTPEEHRQVEEQVQMAVRHAFEKMQNSERE
jgi:hypothetical protein